MERPDDDLLDRWLKAEAEGSDADGDSAADARAEAALTALFAALPLASPAPGFSDRAVRAAMPVWPAVPAVPVIPPASPAFLPGFLASPWGRAGIALGLASAALGLPAFFAALAPLLALLHPALLAPVAARALVEASGWIAFGVRLGRWCAAFTGTLLTPFESPAVTAAMGACLLISAVALRLLYELLQRERNWTYVDPT
jgi:hypothetical protein